MCVKNGVVAAGGFTGELVVKVLGREGVAWSGRVCQSEEGITNGIEIFDSGDWLPAYCTAQFVHAAIVKSVVCTLQMAHRTLHSSIQHGHPHACLALQSRS